MLPELRTKAMPQAMAESVQQAAKFEHADAVWHLRARVKACR